MNRREGGMSRREGHPRHHGGMLSKVPLGLTGPDGDPMNLDNTPEITAIIEKQIHQDFFNKFQDDFDDEDLK